MDNFIKWVSGIGAMIGILSFIYKQFSKLGENSKKILFIDDEYTEFPIIDSLKNNNYDVSAVADVTNIHDEKIKKAKIIFVDYKGVGKLFGKKQGIDLMKALKKKYPKKKIILFSSHKGFGMDADFNIADEMINKGAPLDDFMEIINKY